MIPWLEFAAAKIEHPSRLRIALLVLTCTAVKVVAHGVSDLHRDPGFRAARIAHHAAINHSNAREGWAAIHCHLYHYTTALPHAAPTRATQV